VEVLLCLLVLLGHRLKVSAAFTLARGFRVLWFSGLRGCGKRIGQNLRLDNFIPYALVIALFIFPNLFPYGHQGSSVVELVEKMFYDEKSNASAQLQCTV